MTQRRLLLLTLVLVLPTAGCALGVKPAPVPLSLDEPNPSEDGNILDEYQSGREEKLLVAAQSHWQRGNSSACRRTLEQLLRQNPEHREGKLLLAATHLAAGNLPAAEQVVDAVLARSPDDSEALLAKALMLEMAHRTDEADRIRAQAIRAAATDRSRPLTESSAGFQGQTGGATSDEPAADPAMLLVRQAVSALRNEQPAEAVRTLQAVTRKHPNHAHVQRALGVALYRTGDFHGAQDALRQALSLDNQDALTYFLLGCVLERLGNATAAEEHYSTAERMESASSR